MNKLPLKIVINVDKGTPYDVGGWPVNTHDGDEEPSRIDVQRANFVYSLVMDDNPRVEVWSVDFDGELLELIKEVEI